MTDKEAMNLALEALMYASYEDIEYNDACAAKVLEARNALKERLADPMREVQRLGQQIEQEPVAWICEGSSSDEKHAIDYWQKDLDAIPIGTMLYTQPPQRTEERNFCSRCGKRTPDLITIHTCTPPKEGA